MNMNIGDLLFQLIFLVFMFGFIFSIFFFIRSLVTKNQKNNSIEQKLDRIIDLLEKKQND